MSAYRLAENGHLIDRDKPVSFRFNGQTYSGFDGDTLASALLAQDVQHIAASFKYHRPRGVMTAGSQEPSGVVTLRSGGRQEPNCKAPEVEICEGLDAHPQNVWPSLGFDIQAVNGLLSPIFAAGFYYKTFFEAGQTGWHFFERFIRRAAGMGEASRLPDPDRYERANGFADVLVVGSGAAGLAAALTAARSGAKVLMAEEAAHFGGGLLASSATINGVPARQWCRETVLELTGLPNVTLMARTAIHGLFDDNTVGALERVADHKAQPEPHEARHRHWTIHAGQIVLATGAFERPMVFDGNDRPGVMLASAAVQYAACYGVAIGRAPVVMTNNDSGYQSAFDLRALGVPIATIVDPRDTVDPALLEQAASLSVTVRTGHVVASVSGRKGVKGVRIAPFDVRGGQLTGAGEHLEADAVLVSGGWTPNINLASQAGGKPAFDAELQAFLPGAPRPNVSFVSCGSAAGVFDLQSALASGQEAGRSATEKAGVKPLTTPTPTVEPTSPDVRPAAVFDIPPRRGKGKCFVDFQHDVTASDIALAHREGYVSVEHLKRYTTLGMAIDQGKNANMNALTLMARAQDRPIEEVGTTRFRPPYVPLSLGAIAGRETGRQFRPVRRSPIHDWHVSNDAVMLNTGPWERPRYYPKSGETITEAYIREATTVRKGVGMVDVSFLGKIDVQGPDAAEFLNRVYSNAFLKLPVGKARYGLMLREDGIVYDDGTTWRLSEHQYLMTTTTANAALVLAKMEYWHATAWPELRVKLTSLTDQWAGMAVAGPDSRAVLQAVVTDLALGAEDFGFMAVGNGRIGDIPVTIARLSFSGELAYEVFTASHHGLAVWEAIMAAGQDFDIIPYGTEALGTLRIEKGHVTATEIDGRTTADDLGLGGLCSKKKSFIGSALLGREALLENNRLQLVGLVSKESRALLPGAHLTASGSSESAGHVTATTYSPALERYIALGLLRRGRERHGETLTARFPLRGDTHEIEVVNPVFFDPDGSRMHG
ncbi:MAG: sarcosine oxidase subunit alpha family protein [Alphaproteobacteria bacterium]|nr:sarcosine oxidase subunit alpha family protein [Alphaproteobacteria bacterium]